MNPFMTGCIVALGVLYIGQVNASAHKALTVSALEQEQRQLHIDAQRLAAQIDDLRSLDSVLERQQLLGLVRAERVDHIDAGSDEVALR